MIAQTSEPLLTLTRDWLRRVEAAARAAARAQRPALEAAIQAGAPDQVRARWATCRRWPGQAGSAQALGAFAAPVLNGAWPATGWARALSALTATEPLPPLLAVWLGQGPTVAAGPERPGDALLQDLRALGNLLLALERATIVILTRHPLGRESATGLDRLLVLAEGQGALTATVQAASGRTPLPDPVVTYLRQLIFGDLAPVHGAIRRVGACHGDLLGRLARAVA